MPGTPCSTRAVGLPLTDDALRSFFRRQRHGLKERWEEQAVGDEEALKPWQAWLDNPEGAVEEGEKISIDLGKLLDRLPSTAVTRGGRSAIEAAARSVAVARTAVSATVEQSAEAQRRALAWGEQAAKLEGAVRSELEATEASIKESMERFRAASQEKEAKTVELQGKGAELEDGLQQLSAIQADVEEAKVREAELKASVKSNEERNFSLQHDLEATRALAAKAADSAVLCVWSVSPWALSGASWFADSQFYMNLYVVSLLSAVALGFRADVQYQRVDAIDPAERRKMVESFGKFKAILATNQSRFLKDCAKASDYISDVLSLRPPVRHQSNRTVFFQDPLVLKKNLKIGKKNVEKALKNVKSCLSTPLDYMYLDYVTLGLWKRVQDLVRHTDLGNQSPGAFTVGTWRSQNHLFAIVKRSNTNFHIMQGYIKMHKFLDHLDTFIDNGHEGDTFDGDNHAAMFLVREKNFEGKEYVPAFAWFEDLEKIHEGKLLPGETLKARPGALAALRSDRPEDWTLEQQTSSEVFARDMRQTDEDHRRFERLLADHGGAPGEPALERGGRRGCFSSDLAHQQLLSSARQELEEERRKHAESKEGTKSQLLQHVRHIGSLEGKVTGLSTEANFLKGRISELQAVGEERRDGRDVTGGWVVGPCCD
eukprot:g11029.t1